MEEQLNRIEKRVDEIHAIVHQHVGIVSAVKALLAGVGAAFMAVLAYLGLVKG